MRGKLTGFLRFLTFAPGSTSRTTIATAPVTQNDSVCAGHLLNFYLVAPPATANASVTPGD